MAPASMVDPNDSGTLLESALSGDHASFDRLFDKYRDRLRKLVRLRIGSRLRQFVNSSTVLAETQKASFQRLSDYKADPQLPMFLWLRQITLETMSAMHGRFLGGEGMDQEVTLYHGALPEAASISLAAQLLGKMDNVVDAAIQADNRLKIQGVLNSLEPLDRDVLALRHFERLSNEETALALGIRKSEASHRYFHALTRLQELLSTLPGFRGRV